MKTTDVTVIGGGPAGLAAAIAAEKSGAAVLLIEREARLGGILKQCIHDGFGIVRFKEKLTGPEYAERFTCELLERRIDTMVLTFVTAIEKREGLFHITTVSREGVSVIASKTIILATGCRERTARQVFIHGTRPSGIFTAGTAQHYINILGEMPTKRCVILGSGDIGLIMARRLSLEGAEVIGVYEAKPTPSGLTRNIHQCLNDYDIPLHLSKTVTRVFGNERLTAVEVSSVDEKMQPLSGTAEIIECDSLILSVGLIPENELADKLGVRIDPLTKGPLCNSKLMTSVEAVFACGNALHVNDLVDYVSESGEFAGKAAAEYSAARQEGAACCDAESTAVDIKPAVISPGQGLAYVVPQRLSVDDSEEETVLFFRSREILSDCFLVIRIDGAEVFRKKYGFMKPPEMERLEYRFGQHNLPARAQITLEIEVA